MLSLERGSGVPPWGLVTGIRWAVLLGSNVLCFSGTVTDVEVPLGLPGRGHRYSHCLNYLVCTYIRTYMYIGTYIPMYTHILVYVRMYVRVPPIFLKQLCQINMNSL